MSDQYKELSELIYTALSDTTVIGLEQLNDIEKTITDYFHPNNKGGEVPKNFLLDGRVIVKATQPDNEGEDIEASAKEYCSRSMPPSWGDFFIPHLVAFVQFQKK